MKYLKQFKSMSEYNSFLEKIKDKHSNMSLISESGEIKSNIVFSEALGPKYFGLVDEAINENNITPELILELESKNLPGVGYISNKLYTPVPMKILYAYPEIRNEADGKPDNLLKSIKDQNKFEYLGTDDDGYALYDNDSAFSGGRIEINGIWYLWYLQKKACNLNNMIFEFQ